MFQCICFTGIGKVLMVLCNQVLWSQLDNNQGQTQGKTQGITHNIINYNWDQEYWHKLAAKCQQMTRIKKQLSSILQILSIMLPIQTITWIKQPVRTWSGKISKMQATTTWTKQATWSIGDDTRRSVAEEKIIIRVTVWRINNRGIDWL